ncbi:MAG: hypothetical protein ACRC2T_06025, partial [Thermoguttaceae bacterium]
MSLSQVSSKLLKLTEAIQGCFSSKPKSSKNKKTETRKLSMDVLEERQLLTVSVGTPYDVMINQPNSLAAIPGRPEYATTPIAGTNQSTAANNWGDFVTVWEQQEPAWLRNWDVNNPNYAYGEPIVGSDGYYVPLLDPVKGNVMMETNIYGRYFTDEVQRVTLPTEFLNASGGVSSFSLRYGGNEVQQLSFYTATRPDYSDAYYFGSYYDQSIAGTFRIGGIKAHGENQPEDWVLVHFDESLGPNECAKLIQRELEGLGPYMKGVKVRATSSREFSIEFDNPYWADKDVPELKVVDQNFTAGFMAGAIVTTTNQPITISLYNNVTKQEGIPFDPKNPLQTAQNIQYAFSNSVISGDYAYAPINTNNNVSFEKEHSGIVVDQFAIPEVRVSVVDATTFDITFINRSGKINHQEMMVTSAVDGFGNQHVNPDSIYLHKSYRYYDQTITPVSTLKESSDAFRVNPLEDTSSPYKPTALAITDQHSPVVAMDADGDFIIAWSTEVKSLTNPYNTYDIYSQRFTLQGFMPADNVHDVFMSDGKAIQGVKPVGAATKVNDFDNGNQCDPTIACDMYGNYVIGWASYSGQDFSYFSGVKARWYDRYGSAITQDFSITPEQTTYHYTPRVAMSDNGYTVFAWVLSSAPSHELYKSVYQPVTVNPIPVAVVEREMVHNNAFEPSIAFDAHNRYVLSYTTPMNWPGGTSADTVYIHDAIDVYAGMWGIDTVNNTEYVNRDVFRVNSYDHPGPSQTWYLSQLSSSVALDADGEIIISYQGFAPDMDINNYDSYAEIFSNWGLGSEYYAAVLSQFINTNKNADLIPFLYDGRYSQGGSYLSSYWERYRRDVDIYIRDALIYASKDLSQTNYYGTSSTRPAATKDQMSRLTAVYESFLKLARGAANDIMYTRIDADRNIDNPYPMYSDYITSDAVANNTRDGNNTTLLLTVPRRAIESGNLNFILHRDFPSNYGNGYSSFGEGLSFALAIHANSTVLDIGTTRDNIFNAINGSSIVGKYVYQIDPTIATDAVMVRYIQPDEVENRKGTAWELGGTGGYYNDFDESYVFEITFVGGAHDSNFWITYPQDTGSIKFPDVDAIPAISYMSFYTEFEGNPGTPQVRPSVTMSRAGSYVVTWAQATQSSYSYSSSYNFDTSGYEPFRGSLLNESKSIRSNLFFRNFVESADTTGPKVTDYYLPDGTAISNGEQVSYAIKELVVAFDEQLRDKILDSSKGVDNPKNWTLLKDGVPVPNGIEKIEFRVNASRDAALQSNMTDVNSGALAKGTGKWEAVITFNGSDWD